MAMERMGGRQTGGMQWPARNAGIGEQGGAQRLAADGARHVPGAGKVAGRQNAVGKDDRLAIGDQQYLAHPGVTLQRQVNHVVFVEERRSACFAQYAHLKVRATGNNAGGKRCGVGQPEVQKCGRAGQGGAGFPAKNLAWHRLLRS
jgi:hypothetical protein